MKNLATAANYIEIVSEELSNILIPTVNNDWEILTPDLEWTQSQTAIHTMRACLEYSFQVVGKRIDTYQPVLFEKKEKATPPDYLPMISTASRILQKSITSAELTDRAWHAYGISDPIGFAAMGVVEVSVHTYDLARGFGIEFVPNNDAAEFAIARLFSGTTDFPDYKTHGELLLWLAGRTELSGIPRRQGWKWNGTPR